MELLVTAAKTFFGKKEEKLFFVKKGRRGDLFDKKGAGGIFERKLRRIDVMKRGLSFIK